MKKTVFAAIALCAALAYPATWYNSTNGTDPKVYQPQGDAFSYLLLDVLLDTMETVTSRPIDLLNVPLLFNATGDSTATYTPVMIPGSLLLSCFDVSDSAAVTDTVDARVLLQKAQYAADNIVPGVYSSGGKPDAWVSLDSLLLNTASAASAVVDTGKTIVPVTSERDRFLRVTLNNRSNSLQDKPRCRVYFTKRPIKR